MAKTAKTIALDDEAWEALKDLAAEDRRAQNGELEVLILAERDRRRAAAAANEA